MCCVCRLHPTAPELEGHQALRVWGRRGQSVAALTPLVVPVSVEERRIVFTGTRTQVPRACFKVPLPLCGQVVKGRMDKQERKELIWVGWRTSSKGNAHLW